MSPQRDDRRTIRVSRRRLLQVGVVAGVPAVGGCLAEGRTAIDCNSASRPSADADPDGDVAPVPYPAPDEGLPGVDWVRAHERAFVRNRTIADEGTLREFAFATADEQTEESRGGRVIRIAYRYRYLTDRFVTHSPLVTAAYHVTEEGARRTAAHGDALRTDLDPVDDGDAVVCFE